MESKQNGIYGRLNRTVKPLEPFITSYMGSMSYNLIYLKLELQLMFYNFNIDT